jgi:hypothetical protein
MAIARNVSIPVELGLDDPEAAWRAAHVLTRGEAMGFLGPGGRPRRFDPAALAEVLTAVEAAGIGRRALARLRGTRILEAEALAELDDAMEASPVPEYEWPAITRLLGDELCARLCVASLTSVRRYRAGTRPTPDAVAARLHFLALVVADLAGAYNERGIRSWFGRPRPQLRGRAPAELLEGSWGPNDDGPRSVAALAGALVGAGPGT